MKEFTLYSIAVGLGLIILMPSCRYKQGYYQRKHIPMRELKKSIPDSMTRDTFWKIPEPRVKKPTMANLH